MKMRFNTSNDSEGAYIIRDTTQHDEGLYVIATSFRLDVANAIADILEDNAEEFDDACLAWREILATVDNRGETE